MSEAADTLAKQLEEWEAKAEAARETLRIADGILPALRKALAEIGQESAGPSLGSFESLVAAAQESDDRQPPPAKHEEDEEEGLTQVRAADDVQAIIGAVLGDLPQRFEQSGVQDALNKIGVRVNRSTLRQNLLMLARAEEGFKVRTPGRGRKATVFEKLPAPKE